MKRLSVWGVLPAILFLAIACSPGSSNSGNNNGAGGSEGWTGLIQIYKH